MDQLQDLNTNSSANTSGDTDAFKYYARPLTSKLLETMELNKHYFHGEGDYLYYEQKNKIHKVLDLTGGYGANILGHRNPQILDVVQSWRESGSPSLTQGSIRKDAGLLAKRISEILQDETSEGPWITTFSNTGTEAIEAAYKHSLIHFKHKLTELKQEIEKEMNQALIKIRNSEPELQKKIIKHIRIELYNKISDLRMNEERKSYFLHQISNVHEIGEVISLVREINDLQCSERPVMIALEKAYHGKTMGALSLTYSESFRNAFYLNTELNQNTIFVSQYMDSVKLEEIIESTKRDLLFLGVTTTGIHWLKHSFSQIAAAFVEPIQGEAGIIPVSDSFLAQLKKHSLQENFLLAFDEIQAGMFRTGTLASGTHTHITADIYTFSKSLGGGVAKIAATTINQRKYVEEFGFLHTSTFSDDDFSSRISLEVLDILTNTNVVSEGMKMADYLWARLSTLQGQYPDIINQVRGKGLMLAIEFKDKLAEMGFEFKAICDSKMQGYMMASALLNHENLRMSPSLSNNLTLRIQPSLFINMIQIEELITGLKNLCISLTNKDVKYFLSCIYPDQNVENKLAPDLKINFTPGERPVAVFLCHLIDSSHIKKVTRSMKMVENETLLKKLALTKDLAEFEIYHAQTMTDSSGKEMDVLMLGIAVTSEELKKTFTSKQKYKVVQKVQNAIDFAKELGATTVGLGQFTSIVSGNGLYLDSRGMNLTTGNAFTIGLTVQSALRSAQDKNLDLAKCNVSIIGAAGNIMSVATSLMADHVARVQMIHHSPIESSQKYQQTTRKILTDIVNSNADSKVVKVIKEHWKNQDVLAFLAIPEVQEVLIATSDLNEITKSDIVLCGASASNGFLNLDMFKQGAIVVDVAVPPSIKPDMLKKLKSERPDLTYHLGGVAQIPNKQSIDFFLFPLGENECYACMAETFALGFSGRKNFLNIGDLNKKIVVEVQEVAKNAGFVLGSYKDKSSL